MGGGGLNFTYLTISSTVHCEGIRRVWGGGRYYSGYSNRWPVEPSGYNQLVAIQKWPAYRVEPVYSGHPWNT